MLFRYCHIILAKGRICKCSFEKKSFFMQGSFPPNARRLAHGCCKAAVCRLVEDDGEMHSASYRLLEVTTERYETDSFRYRVVGVERFGTSSTVVEDR